jgi:POT family proton-dependent oligopeptide transporter
MLTVKSLVGYAGLMTQFFNPFFIVTFGSLFSWMWIKLDAMGKNPSIPMKF